MDREKLQNLYQKQGWILIQYLMKNGCSKQDAEDIVQETFVKALMYMDGLEDSNLVAWLFKVSLNKYYDLCRKNKRRPIVSIDDSHFLEDFNQDTQQERIKEEGLSQVLQQEQTNQIISVLESLNPTYKNLLIMKYTLNLSYEEIGQLVDMNGAKVKTYLQRARQAFKKSWKEERYER